MKQAIPIYDICTFSVDQRENDLLVDRLSHYERKNRHRAQQQHGHSFYHLVFFTAGNGQHTIDFSHFKVRPFQLYFMIPGQVHSWDFDDTTEGYVVHFSEGFFRAFLLQHNYLERFPFFSGDSREQVLSVPEAQRAAFTALFEQVYAAAHPLDDDLVRVLLLQLFLQTERYCVTSRGKAVPPQKQLVLRNFLQLINRHYRTMKLPREYAALLYITPNHLNALCQDLLGKTAGEVIRDRIILEARRMLVNPEMTATQIAAELNFEDNSYFSRFFRKYTGMSPDEFRKSIK
ncbi:helix-turn-helix domain-containing protein [Chitinophaga lutea]